MNVQLNGTPASLGAGATVADAAALAGIERGERGVAIAVDGVVVRRSAWETTTLHAGQSLEIVRATAGG